MRVLSAVLLFVLVPTTSVELVAQAQASAAAPATQPAAATASELLQPALGSVRQAIDGVRLDKWKDTNGSRDETAGNISSIRTDLETTLPPLLAAADAAPGMVSQGLPVFRNVEALYDVLLRIVEAGKFCAPKPQSAALEQAIATLDTARRALGEQLQGAAVGQERLLVETQTALRARPVPAATPVTPAPVVRETPPTAKPRKPRPRPKPKTDESAAPKAPAATP